jgi:2,5-diamino-6-(ribosylamino)-4(3H)-pyrimidinone 5'-phosphate reductase
LRAELGSILVGARTVIADDPKLTVKSDFVEEAPPLNKVIIDGSGRVPPSSRVLRTVGRTLIMTSSNCDREWYLDLSEVREKEGLDLEIVKVGQKGPRLYIPDVLSELLERDVKAVLVEGGSETIWSFFELGLFDRFTIYFGPMMMGGNGPSILGGPGFSGDPSPIMIKDMVRTPEGGFLVDIGNAALDQ